VLDGGCDCGECGSRISRGPAVHDERELLVLEMYAGRCSRDDGHKPLAGEVNRVTGSG
jgi:hypothetical protein